MRKKQLWEQRDREDRGSRHSISIKTADGEVRNITTLPKDAKVTSNSTNMWAEERAKNANTKEDLQLERFCDGNNHAWRPDTFFTETCGEADAPPWPVRPSELFANPQICMKIMAATFEKKEQRKKEKKQQKKGEKEK